MMYSNPKETLSDGIKNQTKKLRKMKHENTQ